MSERPGAVEPFYVGTSVEDGSPVWADVNESMLIAAQHQGAAMLDPMLNTIARQAVSDSRVDVIYASCSVYDLNTEDLADVIVRDPSELFDALDDARQEDMDAHDSDGARLTVVIIRNLLEFIDDALRAKPNNVTFGRKSYEEVFNRLHREMSNQNSSGFIFIVSAEPSVWDDLSDLKEVLHSAINIHVVAPPRDLFSEVEPPIKSDHPITTAVYTAPNGESTIMDIEAALRTYDPEGLCRVNPIRIGEVYEHGAGVFYDPTRDGVLAITGGNPESLDRMTKKIVQQLDEDRSIKYNFREFEGTDYEGFKSLVLISDLSDFEKGRSWRSASDLTEWHLREKPMVIVLRITGSLSAELTRMLEKFIWPARQKAGVFPIIITDEWSAALFQSVRTRITLDGTEERLRHQIHSLMLDARVTNADEYGTFVYTKNGQPIELVRYE